MTDMPLKVSGPFRSFRELADDLIDATEKIDPADYPGWALRLWFHALGTVRSEVNDWLLLELGYFTDYVCDQRDVFNDEIETYICNQFSQPVKCHFHRLKQVAAGMWE